MNINSQILSEITTFMKYARYKSEDQRRETWEEIVDRNKQMHLERFPQIAEAIEDAYKLVYEKKVLPSMRSLQFAGKAMDVNPVRGYNCSGMNMDDWRAFPEAMFLLLSGTGVGVSVQRQHVDKLPAIKKPDAKKTRRYVVGDSIAGWADAVKHLMKSYMGMNKSTPIFDYSDIREKGAELITSGGKAPGSQPLRECLVKIEGILSNKVDGEKLKPIEVHDIICYIAESVLSGGIRRSAVITLFSIDDIEMKSAKSGSWWELNPQRAMSNNSVALPLSETSQDDFFGVWEYSKASGAGEPGFSWSNNLDKIFNPCFGGEEKLLTVDGYKTFEELDGRNDIKLINKDGEVSVGKVWCSGEKETVVVKTTCGDEMICTPDHVWMLNDGTECEAKDLEGKVLMSFAPPVDESKLFSIVLSVTPHKKVKVYDFTEPKTHWGVVNGYVAHNCHEVSLSDTGLCNLTEINASDIEDEVDFNRRCWAASLIGTLQASYTDFYYLRDKWRKTAEKEALLGVSMTGIASMEVFKYDIKKGVAVVRETNKIIANLIGINTADRLTVVKPAGTTSLVLGTSSGIHAWHDDYFIRRVRVDKKEAIYTYLSINHPELLEDDWMRPDTTAVISVPIKAPDGSVTRNETALDLLSRVLTITKDWVWEGHNDGDNKNNVSCTVSIKEGEWDTVRDWMWDNRHSYTGISVLPFNDHSYKQAPFESCTEEVYNELSKTLHKVDLSGVVELSNNTNLQGEAACGGGGCEVS